VRQFCLKGSMRLHPRLAGRARQVHGPFKSTLLFLALCFGGSGGASGAAYLGNPANYTHLLGGLRSGDVLTLEPGHYDRGLRVHDLHGSFEKPIVIEGPSEGRPAVLLGQQGKNTVSIKNAGYVVVRNLEIDGRGAFVDAVKAEGNADFAHHITLENLYIHNFAAQQQSVGISTKCPAWGWTVRGNRIEGVGTGMYFGDSDGSDPFIGGVIEENLVENTIGYNLQIKHQTMRPALAGIPTEPRMTIIRRNRFIKAKKGSEGPEARPSVLVGHFPLQGPGKNDKYAIYGNLFFQNPGEALFQGEGNFALYTNLFYNSYKSEFPAIAIQPHNDIPRLVRVFFNTVVHPGEGIRILSGKGSEDFVQEVVGNAVFADLAIQGGSWTDNFVAEYGEAFEYLRLPVTDLSEMSLAPQEGRLCAMHQIALLAGYPESDRDFYGRLRDRESFGAVSPVAACQKSLPSHSNSGRKRKQDLVVTGNSSAATS